MKLAAPQLITEANDAGEPRIVAPAVNGDAAAIDDLYDGIDGIDGIDEPAGPAETAETPAVVQGGEHGSEEPPQTLAGVEPSGETLAEKPEDKPAKRSSETGQTSDERCLLAAQLDRQQRKVADLSATITRLTAKLKVAKKLWAGESETLVEMEDHRDDGNDDGEDDFGEDAIDDLPGDDTDDDDRHQLAEADLVASEAADRAAEDAETVCQTGELPLPAADRAGETAAFVPPAANDDSWKDIDIEHLDIPEGILAALREQRIETVGDIADYTKDGAELTTLNKIGPKKAEQIEAALVKFWQDWNAGKYTAAKG